MAIPWAAIGSGLKVAGAASSLFGKKSDGFSQKGASQQRRYELIRQKDDFEFWRDNVQPIEDARRRSQIQERVGDAKAAGLHPLYALGYGGQSSPIQSFGGSTYTPTGQPESGSLVGDALGAMGQAATQFGNSKTQKALARQNAISTTTYNALVNDKLRMETKLLEQEYDFAQQQYQASQLARVTQAVNHQGYPAALAEQKVQQKAQNIAASLPETYAGKTGTWDISNPGGVKRKADAYGDELSQLMELPNAIKDWFNNYYIKPLKDIGSYYFRPGYSRARKQRLKQQRRNYR